MSEPATYLGDSKRLVFQMTWEGQPFTPDDSWFLLSTIKRRIADPDTEAVVQKASGGGGLTTDGSTATVTLIPEDTNLLLHGIYWIDIRATSLANSKTITVVKPIKVELNFVVSRKTQASIPIYVIEEPFPPEGILGPMGPPGPPGPQGPKGLDASTSNQTFTNTTLAGNTVVTGGFKLGWVTVSTLPPAANSLAMEWVVTDAITPAVGSPVGTSGSGPAFCKVISNGTDWLVTFVIGEPD